MNDLRDNTQIQKSFLNTVVITFWFKLSSIGEQWHLSRYIGHMPENTHHRPT